MIDSHTHLDLCRPPDAELVAAARQGVREEDLASLAELSDLLAELAGLVRDLGALIVETAGLSFIGLGAQPPTADWGTMLADGRQFMMTAPHVAAIPGVAVLGLVWGLNMIGDGLRDLLDPTLAHATR